MSTFTVPVYYGRRVLFVNNLRVHIYKYNIIRIIIIQRDFVRASFFFFIQFNNNNARKTYS